MAFGPIGCLYFPEFQRFKDYLNLSKVVREIAQRNIERENSSSSSYDSFTNDLCHLGDGPFQPSDYTLHNTASESKEATTAPVSNLARRRTLKNRDYAQNSGLKPVKRVRQKEDLQVERQQLRRDLEKLARENYNLKRERDEARKKYKYCYKSY